MKERSFVMLKFINYYQVYGQPSPSGRSENRNSTFCYNAVDDDDDDNDDEDDDDDDCSGDGDNWQLHEKCGYSPV